MQGSGFRVQGSGCRVQVAAARVQAEEASSAMTPRLMRYLGSGFTGQHVVFKVQEFVSGV